MITQNADICRLFVLRKMERIFPKRNRYSKFDHLLQLSQNKNHLIWHPLVSKEENHEFINSF